MTNLLRWLLTRLEAFPSAVFREGELRSRFPDEFDVARLGGIIGRLPVAADVGALARESGRSTFLSEGGAFIGLCEEEEDAVVEAISIEEASCWRIEIGTLCSEYRSRNDLGGPCGVLHERLIQLGEISRGRVVFLGFLVGRESGVQLLKAIPSQVPQANSEFVVICPSFQLEPSESRLLESLGIKVGPMDDQDPFLLPAWASAPTAPRAVGDEIEPEFEHSPENRWVKLRGREWTLPPMANMVISLLAEARRVGRPDLHWKQITSKLPGEPGSMHDMFKSVPDWDELVVSRRKGVFRLNLPS